ncbi:uncharacterized protein LOC123266916 [Cotesia glomerata]|uniref:uncharacterized protein LOC123266916 n=1 Tax=Cotesia glomerata TaxID=32391 RepID=UPI001D02407E|nr:uncharacterized protein LOC123266916 [Cotesia glomerata]
MSKKRSRSRSRSRSRDKKRRKDEKIDKLQSQMDNLAETVKTLAESIKLLKNVSGEKIVTADSESEVIKDADKDGKNVVVEVDPPSQSGEQTPDQVEQVSIKEVASKILGMDQECTYKEAKYMSELNGTWSKWALEGLPEKNKKAILEAYNRKGEFYTEAPKLNLELGPLLTDIAKKRDQHFADTQNCIGTALSALGAAVSLLLEPPEEGLDEDLFTDYISHAGQILSDVFYQQSVARKSYITPQLNKNIKPLVDNMLSKEWLYGDDLKDKVKDMKEIEKACAEIKEKPPVKSAVKSRDQGNGRYPPANNRQVGYQQRRRVMRFRQKSSTTSQRPAKPASRSTNQSSSRK